MYRGVWSNSIFRNKLVHRFKMMICHCMQGKKTEKICMIIKGSAILSIKFALSTIALTTPNKKITTLLSTYTVVPIACCLCPHTQWCHLTAVSVHIHSGTI